VAGPGPCAAGHRPAATTQTKNHDVRFYFGSAIRGIKNEMVVCEAAPLVPGKNCNAFFSEDTEKCVQYIKCPETFGREYPAAAAGKGGNAYVVEPANKV
jgi:hypothetical protein